MTKERFTLLALYGLILIVIGTIVYAFMPFPPDDFLRHVRFLDYKTDGGYSFMFPDSYFKAFHFNPWFGFDQIAGTLKNHIGLQGTLAWFQAVTVCLFITALLMNMKTASRSDLFGVTCVCLFLYLSYSYERIVLIRPAILLGIMFLVALRGRGFLAGYVWMLCAAPLYWLFWVYSIPLAIGHYFKGDRRFGMALFIGTVAALCGWVLISNGEYIETIHKLLLSLFSGRGGISIGENRFSLGRLASPVVFVLAATFLGTIYRERKVDFLLLLIILTAPFALQIRYFTDITMPLAFLYTINHNVGFFEALYDRYKPVIEAAGIVSMVLIMIPLMAHSYYGPSAVRLDGIELKKGSTVFCDSMTLGFSLIYFNREPVKVIPSPEIGWNSKETLEVFKGIGKESMVGDSICAYMKKNGVNYFLTEKAVNARCLTAVKSFPQGDMSRRIGLWQVR